MQFGILGPVQVSGPPGIVDIGGARQRRLLAALILHVGGVASTDRLIDIVFEGEPPAGATTTIRSYIARLRKALADASPGVDEVISTEQGGYSLRIDVDAIDAAQFAALDRHGSAPIRRAGPDRRCGHASSGTRAVARRGIRRVRFRGVGTSRGIAPRRAQDGRSRRAQRCTPRLWFGPRCRVGHPQPDLGIPAAREASKSAHACAVPCGASGRGLAEPRGVSERARRGRPRTIRRPVASGAQHRIARPGTASRLTRRATVARVSSGYGARRGCSRCRVPSGAAGRGPRGCDQDDPRPAGERR